MDEITTARLTGVYIDPKAGKVTLTKFSEQLLARKVWETNTTRTARRRGLDPGRRGHPAGAVSSTLARTRFRTAD